MLKLLNNIKLLILEMTNKAKSKPFVIPEDLGNKLIKLGIIPDMLSSNPSIRTYNIGNSDYSKHIIQPWSIWIDYNLNPFDADIIKRILRTKKGDSRKMDYEKIIHICQERIRQINIENKIKDDNIEL